MDSYDFIQKWDTGGPAAALNERQGAQTYFLDLCALLDVPTPGSEDGYVFEQDALLLGQARGYADVFKRNCFAWENKKPGADLDQAFKQLLNYSSALSNPPLLVVCDRSIIRVHTHFNGHPSVVHRVLLQELDQPEKRALLRNLWLDPESFRPRVTNRDITEAAARSFATLAEQLRQRGHDADAVAHFLTQCLFCFFAEDVGLLPSRMFEQMVNNRRFTSQLLSDGLHKLFTAMQAGGPFGSDVVPWFNGGLFKRIAVPKLEIIDITELRKAAGLNWSAIDVSIFGTLFERGLDPAKRSQLGAHYTDPATIMRLIGPIIQRPLLQLWEQEKAALATLLSKSKKKADAHYKAAHAQFVRWLDSLARYRVLDPACGSGNFLFLGLKVLKDIEHQSHIEAAALGLDREADLVTGPHNVLGIELNEYAAELARVTVWIGELQWRMDHGYPFKENPVLEPLDHIECRDALVAFVPVAADAVSASRPATVGQGPGAHKPAAQNRANPLPHRHLETADAGKAEVAAAAPTQAVEADWPWASVVIGNPPFLGDKKMRSELGDDYTTALRKTYEGRVPGGADLVCYWFEKARTAIETNGLGAAGLVATQSIRSGSNRAVLSAICESSNIYEAWSDEAWVNEGAAVRVSLVCFGHATQAPVLNGKSVSRIAADLSSDSGQLDLTAARPLCSNGGAAFQGPVKVGSFDIAGEIARVWLTRPNVNGKSNAAVLRPLINGQDLAKRSADSWIIDFGPSMNESDAALFEAPFLHVSVFVKPQRLAQKDLGRKLRWWIHGRSGEDYRAASLSLARYIASPRVAKHRYFVWLHERQWPDSRVYVIARADDTTFGILSSRIHEVWSLAQASIHGDGSEGGRPTYNAKSCFETFPFPQGLTPADTAHQQTEAVDGGALIPAGLAGYGNPGGGEAQGERDFSRKAYERSACASPPPGAKHETQQNQTTQHDQTKLRDHAIAIAQAAQRLNALREAWLNPPEWTRRVPEVVPLGMQTSPYPDRIEALPGHEKDLAERTLTKLYNQRPAWLSAAHQALDAAVAAAYGWADYSVAMPDEEILKRLLALNLSRCATIPPAS